VNTHPFNLKFVVFCHEFSEDAYVEFQEKTILGKNFRNFCANQGYIHYGCLEQVYHKSQMGA